MSSEINKSAHALFEACLYDNCRAFYVFALNAANHMLAFEQDRNERRYYKQQRKYLSRRIAFMDKYGKASINWPVEANK